MELLNEIDSLNEDVLAERLLNYLSTLPVDTPQTPFETFNLPQKLQVTDTSPYLRIAISGAIHSTLGRAITFPNHASSAYEDQEQLDKLHTFLKKIPNVYLSLPLNYWYLVRFENVPLHELSDFERQQDEAYMGVAPREVVSRYGVEFSGGNPGDTLKFTYTAGKVKVILSPIIRQSGFEIYKSELILLNRLANETLETNGDVAKKALFWLELSSKISPRFRYLNINPTLTRQGYYEEKIADIFYVIVLLPIESLFNSLLIQQSANVRLNIDESGLGIEIQRGIAAVESLRQMHGEGYYNLHSCFRKAEPDYVITLGGVLVIDLIEIKARLPTDFGNTGFKSKKSEEILLECLQCLIAYRKSSMLVSDLMKSFRLRLKHTELQELKSKSKRRKLNSKDLKVIKLEALTLTENDGEFGVKMDIICSVLKELKSLCSDSAINFKTTPKNEFIDEIKSSVARMCEAAKSDKGALNSLPFDSGRFIDAKDLSSLSDRIKAPLSDVIALMKTLIVEQGYDASEADSIEVFYLSNEVVQNFRKDDGFDVESRMEPAVYQMYFKTFSNLFLTKNSFSDRNHIEETLAAMISEIGSTEQRDEVLVTLTVFDVLRSMKLEVYSEDPGSLNERYQRQIMRYEKIKEHNKRVSESNMDAEPKRSKVIPSLTMLSSGPIILVDTDKGEIVDSGNHTATFSINESRPSLSSSSKLLKNAGVLKRIDQIDQNLEEIGLTTGGWTGERFFARKDPVSNDVEVSLRVLPFTFPIQEDSPSVSIGHIDLIGTIHMYINIILAMIFVFIFDMTVIDALRRFLDQLIINYFNEPM